MKREDPTLDQDRVVMQKCDKCLLKSLTTPHVVFEVDFVTMMMMMLSEARSSFSPPSVSLSLFSSHSFAGPQM